jgi:hypothetical protein
VEKWTEEHCPLSHSHYYYCCRKEFVSIKTTSEAPINPESWPPPYSFWWYTSRRLSLVHMGRLLTFVPRIEKKRIILGIEDLKRLPDHGNSILLRFQRKN